VTAGAPSPALRIRGEDDPSGAPDVGERMVEIMPDAELVVVGGAHAPWLTRLGRIGPLIARFLRRNG
jgi:pimeloyl-ACP methyl ester carboxylesterase